MDMLKLLVWAEIGDCDCAAQWIKWDDPFFFNANHIIWDLVKGRAR